jgi:phosphopantothenoylcysteine decarboxylase / phosphopantothenate---cysteine ligase
VSGSIAAYKAATIASTLVKSGHEVRALLTNGASRFISPLTFEALTGHPVAVDIWDEHAGTSHIGHVETARWAEALAVAPAGARTIVRLALGVPEDMLSATALSYRGPLLVAPAMESAMFEHPATQAHLATLVSRGAVIVGPGEGRLASGAMGIGRMAEPEEVVSAIQSVLDGASNLRDVRVLVTAGPTFEPIDPVRFLGNRSSGKMGFAVAAEAHRRGARVTLISGPTNLSPTPMKTVEVETTEEMRQAVLGRIADCDVLVMAAAVADFRPREVFEGKRARTENLTLALEPTADIAAEAARVAPSILHVGFALETQDLLPSARRKLERKGQSLVVANALSTEHNPFGSELNRVAFVTSQGVEELPLLPKREVARLLWDRLRSMLESRTAVDT